MGLALLLTAVLICTAADSAAAAGNYCAAPDTNPWSNGTPCSLTTTPLANGVEYYISAPVVDRATFSYPTVSFHPGDQITVRAGGCVQTGGSGATWKRYVDPSGADSGPEDPGLYHGTITIPGGFAEGSALGVLDWSIQHAIRVTQASPIVVASPAGGGPPPSSTLTLGYRDDGYDDNGYYAHDDGNNGQCAYGNDGGSAYVVIDVVHGPPAAPPSLAPAKAFDVAPTGYDNNWFPQDPMWGWQVPGVSTKATRQGYYLAECDAPPLFPAPPTCTTQATQYNPAPDPSFLSDPWRHVKDAFGLCRYPLTVVTSNGNIYSGGNGGHLNWSPVTYQDGRIYWAKWDTPLRGDDDYNLSLTTPSAGDHYSGVTPPTDSIPAESPMALEFDSDETIDHLGRVYWWQQFHDAVYENPGSDQGRSGSGAAWLRRNIDGHEAVAGGVLGLDNVHGPDAGSEIHPVQMLAIRGATPSAVDPGNDQWDFFVRNWGDEGECSSEQEYLTLQQVTLRLPPPASLTASGGSTPQALAADISSQDVWGFGIDAAPSLWVDGTGAYVTVHLPAASAGGMLFGDVHLKWRVVSPTARVGRQSSGAGRAGNGHGASHGTSELASPAASSVPGEDGQPEAELAAAVAHLAGAQRKRYDAAVYPYVASLPVGAPTKLALVSASVAPRRPAAPPVETLTYDARHVRNVISRWYALCRVTDGQPFGLAGACPSEGALKSLPPPRVLLAPGAPQGYVLAGKTLPVDRETNGRGFWHAAVVVAIGIVALAAGVLALLILVAQALWKKRRRGDA